MEWYLKVLKNYVGFSGRARRKEYWMFVLFNIIFAVVAAGVATAFIAFSSGFRPATRAMRGRTNLRRGLPFSVVLSL